MLFGGAGCLDGEMSKRNLVIAILVMLAVTLACGEASEVATTTDEAEIEPTEAEDTPTPEPTEPPPTETAEPTDTRPPPPTLAAVPTETPTEDPWRTRTINTEGLTGLAIEQLSDVEYDPTQCSLVIRNKSDQEANLQGWRVYVVGLDIDIPCYINWDAPVPAGGTYELTCQPDSCGVGYGFSFDYDASLRLVDPNMNTVQTVE